jgi:hypothetical protein
MKTKYKIQNSAKSQMPELESSLTRHAKNEKAQFTFVNEHFEFKHNDGRGLFRKA